MLFNFFINQYLFLSIAKENAQPLIQALQALPLLPPASQWLHFLRHHDELSLKLLHEEEKAILFERFAPAENMRIYGKGIRRRLASMLNGDRRMIELCYSLLFSLPGIPLIRYGDEIGMGEDLSLHGRNSVRTPMQWSAAQNGGFSTAVKEQLVHPVIGEGLYGYQSVNVAKEQNDPASLLNWMKRLIQIRKQCPEIGEGKMDILHSKHTHLFVHTYHLNNDRILLLHNLSSKKVAITKKDIGLHDSFIDILSDDPVPLDEPIYLNAYAYKWLRLINTQH